jgi:hypothetical protein
MIDEPTYGSGTYQRAYTKQVQPLLCRFSSEGRKNAYQNYVPSQLHECDSDYVPKLSRR